MDEKAKKRLDKFLRYVKIDTQSNEESNTAPSAEKEYDLLNLLKEELLALGLKDAEIDKYGRLYAHLDGEEGWERIGLNSHVDTASEASGKNVNPIIHENYDGKDIVLPNGLVTSVADFPRLKNYVGDTIVTTDGTTLLGGDDKAGLAIIMNALEELIEEGVPHHPVSVLFTPDEEIGRGPEHFDNERFGAEYAYTIDGADPDLIEYENFNAAHAEVRIEGLAIHPGEAKGKLINALTLLEKLDLSLGVARRPEMTEGYEGFFHLIAVKGDSASCEARYLIREHDKAKFEAMKQELLDHARELNAIYPKAKIDVHIKDDYRNMKEILDKDPRAIEHAKKAFAAAGIPMRVDPIRGGTDGATFSFLGCPTPNLGTGSYNHHGEREYLSLRDYETLIELVKKILTVR